MHNQNFLSETTFRFQFQTFPWHCNTIKLHIKIRSTDEKNRFQPSRTTQLHSPLERKEAKEKMYPISIIYVWTTFEQQVKDLYESQKVQVYSCLRRPETHFQYRQGHQRAGALTCSINNLQKRNYTLNGIGHQKAINLRKLGNELIVFQMQSMCNFITTWTRLEDA